MPDTRIRHGELLAHCRAKKLVCAGETLTLFVACDCYDGEDEDVRDLLADALALVRRAAQLIGSRSE